ncbi:MAG: putative bifunctional diguanylate cyclase/phosphodiesterase [Solirubrobacteraceae bacterium]
MGSVRRAPGRGGYAANIGLLVAAGVLAIVTAPSARWNLPEILVISALTAISDLTSVATGAGKLKVSGSFLGLMLAAVLLGGPPAALIGVLTIGIGWVRWREDWHFLLNNLATYAWFPLIGGWTFQLVSSAANMTPTHLSYYLLVFAVFVLALSINFTMIAAYHRYLGGPTIRQQANDAVVPVLSSELFSALLTMAAVYAGTRLGVTGLMLFALVLVIFQYLVGELLASKQRGIELHRMATTDELTGLANREQFRSRLEEAIADCETSGEGFGVLLIDLDRFKEINDTLGHDSGDWLLRDLGPRLAECVGEGGLVARLGGDEFGVLPPARTSDPRVLEVIAARLLSCFQLPFTIEELSLEIGASIGISRYPVDGRDSHSLLRRADIAMYIAKEKATGFRIYTPDQDKHSIERLSVLGDFRRAISAGEIVLHFQPIVDLQNMHVHGAEGLVRWQHPERGLIPPGAFIQSVEQTGLIAPLTRFVLERAAEECAIWRAAGEEMCVSVNLSVRNLLDRHLPLEIERLLSRHSLPPEALKLEITESMIMSDPERALSTITYLSSLGVRFAVDDFGTGYSSLAYLSRLPINELKIDRSFVSPMLKDASDLIIVRSTINLAHDLGLAIIAEGVEDEPTLERLGELGCDRVQGFHLGRPMTADAFTEWMRPHRADDTLEAA